jgi:hypothetical protein
MKWAVMVKVDCGLWAESSINEVMEEPGRVPTLLVLCEETIVRLIEKQSPKCFGKLINELCKYVPNELMEPIFEKLLDKGDLVAYEREVHVWRSIPFDL